MGVVNAVEVRRQVLQLLVKLFLSLDEPDYFSTAQCYVYLNEPQPTSELLRTLLQRSDKDERAVLVAYQTAFDLVESATQDFLHHVRSELEKMKFDQDAPKQQVISSLSGTETIRL